MENYRPVIPVEEQFKIMANSAPVLIWISGLDKLCYFFNTGWLRFTGRTMREEFGNGWTDGVHPDDYDSCLETYTRSFDLRESFTMEYRLRRHDGVYRWVTDTGVPRYLDDGIFAGYIGTCVDVNELVEKQHKRSESLNQAALEKEQELNERLAAANEEMTVANEELMSANEELSVAQESLSLLNSRLEQIVLERTQELSISEQRYRSLVDHAPVAIGTLTGEDLVITSANDMILKFWGKNKEILGLKLVHALPELKGQRFLEILNEVYKTAIPFYGNEIRALLEHAGTIKECYFNFIYMPLKDLDGNTESIMMVAIDVTEQVTSRIKVEDSSNRLHNMVMTAPIGMTILKGRSLVVEIANQQMLEVWHREKDQVMNKKIWDIFPEIEELEFNAIIKSVFDTGKAVKIPEVLSPHLEKENYIDISYDPLFDKNGVVESILATVIDITDRVNSRKLVEESEYNLQTINEELLSSNEELLSTNEHLEEIKSQLEQSMVEVSANETRFRFMLNAIPQQVWTANSTGALAYVNDVVCEDFGYTTEEVVGHGWQEFIHPNDLVSCLEEWENALTTGGEYMVEFRLRFADGNYYWHLARALPLVEEGGVTLWLGTNTNIQIQKQNEEAKDEFLSIASHELKTPLTTIKAYNQLMMRSNQKHGLEAFIKKSSDQIYRLEKLITDLLDVTKINAGKMSYNMETFNFREMIMASIESVQHTSPNHEIILTEGTAIEYAGDRFRLEQVLHNFLSNAIKYSPNGKKVIVDCKVAEDNIIVSVQDFGVGIAEQSLNKLFNRYYRVDNTAMRFDGLGLGLFISSEILKRHQGSFWIESTEGQGSTFYFGLPLLSAISKKHIQSDSFYQDQHIIISYNDELEAVHVDWKGFQSLATIQHSATHILEMLGKHKATKILNDNTDVLGTWSEASEWVGMRFFPMIEKAGVKHFAWVYSQSGFSQLSANKSVDVMLGNVKTQLFTEIEEAKRWLATKS